jgi:formylglycine-generating enzyme required for sulfatase activity
MRYQIALSVVALVTIVVGYELGVRGTHAVAEPPAAAATTGDVQFCFLIASKADATEKPTTVRIQVAKPGAQPFDVTLDFPKGTKSAQIADAFMDRLTKAGQKVEHVKDSKCLFVFGVAEYDGSDPQGVIRVTFGQGDGAKRMAVADDGKRAKPASSVDVTKFLSGWAASEGTDTDTVTGYPKRIKRAKDGAEMVLVPAGTFLMGAVPGDSKAEGGEKPRHSVTLTKSYYVDVTEVTVGQWKKFVAGGGGRMPTDLRNAATDLHPIYNVNFPEATAFATWVGGALPTEAQWERAARGGHDDFVYPWGPIDDEKKRNGSGSADGFDGLAPVRSYEPNAYGLYDMAGNVSEWCADWIGGKYYAASPASDPSGPGSGSLRAVRGGSWIWDGDYLRATDRGSSDPGKRIVELGVRCAKTLP